MLNNYNQTSTIDGSSKVTTDELHEDSLKQPSVHSAKFTEENNHCHNNPEPDFICNDTSDNFKTKLLQQLSAIKVNLIKLNRRISLLENSKENVSKEDTIKNEISKQYEEFINSVCANKNTANCTEKDVDSIKNWLRHASTRDKNNKVFEMNLSDSLYRKELELIKFQRELNERNRKIKNMSKLQSLKVMKECCDIFDNLVTTSEDFRSTEILEDLHITISRKSGKDLEFLKSAIQNFYSDATNNEEFKCCNVEEEVNKLATTINTNMLQINFCQSLSKNFSCLMESYNTL
ncbi:hypothetical protein FQA39_LY17141 [Lamprigera yunnana]|nr:hypothetical protein FQA39_LY17141 [Lamprigera yunnana]